MSRLIAELELIQKTRADIRRQEQIAGRALDPFPPDEPPDPYDAKRLEIVEPVPVRNFHMVEPWLYRGGQPGADGLKALAGMGIKTIVCLRWGSKTIRAEESAAEALAMNFVSIPLNYWNLPSQETIDHFLALLDEPSNWPIFVHCFHGSDRTGLFIAIFRMSRQQWTVHDAYKEMKRFGFHRFRLRNFKWWLWKYSRKLY